jgi:large subunit ribosomal protein L10
MSKSVKQSIMRDYQSRLGDVEEAMVISIRGVKGTDTTRFRNKLRKSNIRVTVVQNSLARNKFKGTGLEPLGKLLTGASALAYSTEQSVVTIARQIVESLKDFPAIELKGAVLDGTLYEGKARVEELSKFPTKEEAIAQNLTLILSPARKLAAQIKGPGAGVAGLIKAIEAKLEKGETIAKAG